LSIRASVKSHRRDKHRGRPRKVTHYAFTPCRVMFHHLGFGI
jgi:ribosomal protein S14